MGYLVGPIEWDSFTSCMKRVVFVLRRTMRRKIRIKSVQGMFVVPLSEILYVKVERHTLFYYLHPKTKQKYRILKVRGSSLQGAEEFLQRYDFARCSGSCMVNLHYVMAIMNNTLYVPESMLTISRTYKEEFQDKVVKYLNEREVWSI